MAKKRSKLKGGLSPSLSLYTGGKVQRKALASSDTTSLRPRTNEAAVGVCVVSMFVFLCVYMCACVCMGGGVEERCSCECGERGWGVYRCVCGKGGGGYTHVHVCNVTGRTSTVQYRKTYIHHR